MKSNKVDNVYLNRDNIDAKSISDALPNEKSLEKKSKKKRSKSKAKAKKTWVSRLLDFVIVALIAIGLFLIIRPFYVAYKQDRVMDDLTQLIKTKKQNDKKSNSTPNHINGTLIDGNGIWVDANANRIEGEALEDFGQEEDPHATTAPYYYLEPLGMIQIDSINVNLPLLKGAGYVPLRYGAGWYEDSAEIGSPGRATILGHSAYTNDRFFSKLKNVNVGDKVRIVRQDKIYEYNVSNVEVIPQEQLINYLTNSEVPSQLLLITCHNAPSWSQRLLVFADLVNVKNVK